MTDQDSSDEEWINPGWSNKAKSPIVSNLDFADLSLINHWAVRLRFKKDGEPKLGSGFFINLPADTVDYHLILTAAHNLTNLQGVHTTDLHVFSSIPGVDIITIKDSDWSNVFISKSYVGDGKPETDYGAIRVPKAKLKVTGFGFSMKLAYEETFKGKITVTGWQKTDSGSGEILQTSSDICTTCYPGRVEYATKTKEGMSGSAVYIEYKSTFAAIAIHNNSAASKGSGVRLTPELLCEIFAWVSPKIVFRDVQLCAKDIRKQPKGTTLPSLGLFLSFMDDFGFGRVRLGSGTKFEVMPAEIVARSSNLYAMSVTRTGQRKWEWVTFNPNSSTKKVGLSEAMIDSCFFEKVSKSGIWFKVVASSGTVKFQLRIQGQEIDETDEEMESSEVSWEQWPTGNNELFNNFVFK